MKTFIVFVLTVSAVIAPHPDSTNRIPIRVMSAPNLTALVKAAAPPVKCRTLVNEYNLVTARYTYLRQVMEGAGNGSIWGSITINKKEIKNFSSVEHCILIPGPEGNGYTGTISLLKYLLGLLQNGKTEKITFKITILLSEQFTDPLLARFTPIFKIIKAIVTDYQDFYENDFNPQGFADRLNDKLKKVAIDALSGTGKDGAEVESDKAFAMNIVEGLITRKDVVVLGHDGKSLFGSKFQDGRLVSLADIVVNTSRVQEIQSSEGLVTIDGVSDILKQKMNEDGFNRKPNNRTGILVFHVSIEQDIDEKELKNMFADAKTAAAVFKKMGCEKVEYNFLE